MHVVNLIRDSGSSQSTRINLPGECGRNHDDPPVIPSSQTLVPHFDGKANRNDLKLEGGTAA